MTVSLPSPIAALIDEKVATGQYASAADVIQAGLELLVEREQEAVKLEELRVELSRGLEQIRNGQSKPFDLEVAKRALNNRLALGDKTKTIGVP